MKEARWPAVTLSLYSGFNIMVYRSGLPAGILRKPGAILIGYMFMRYIPDIRKTPSDEGMKVLLLTTGALWERWLVPTAVLGFLLPVVDGVLRQPSGFFWAELLLMLSASYLEMYF